MITLAIESSTALGSIALVVDGKTLAESQSLLQRSHSEFLNQAVLNVLSSAQLTLDQIDLIATSPGPGSFTGVRVASSLAKTLSYSLKKPIWSVDSLRILASLGHDKDNKQKFVAINAFKNMIYGSFFLGDTLIVGPSVLELKNLSSNISQVFPSGSIYYCGDSWSLITENIEPSVGTRFISPSHSSQIYPTASILGSLSHLRPDFGLTLDWNSHQPLYLRASEAEENLRLRDAEKK